MTIETTTNQVSYAGDGTSVAFSFPNYFLVDADLVVILKQDSDGSETLQTLATDYNISGAGVIGSGGTVTFVTAPASGYTIVIYRDPALTQTTDLVENDPHPAETEERSFDKLTMIVQRLKDRLDNSLRLRNSDFTGDFFLPVLVDRISMYLGFDSSGDPVALAAPTGTSLTSVFGQTLIQAADAAAARTTLVLPFSQLSQAPTNVGIAATVAASALTISLKGADGNAPSSTNPVKIPFRNVTSATGDLTTISVTAPVTLTISSGSTLGHASAVSHYIYLYALNNGGTVSLAASSVFLDYGSVQSVVAEGGAGAADSNSVLYGPASLSNKAIQFLGRMKSTQATAGTWAAVPTEITPYKCESQSIAARYTSNSTQSIPNSADTIVNFEDKDYDTMNAVTVGASWQFKAPRAGIYSVSCLLGFDSNTNWTLGERIFLYLFKNGVNDRSLIRWESFATNTFLANVQGHDDILLAKDDTIDFRVNQNSGAANVLLSTSDVHCAIKYIGQAV